MIRAKIDSRWANVSRVPTEYLKAIQVGSLKGKTDINPQWRLRAMTETYGLCGEGWTHKAEDRWTQECPEGQIMCFVSVAVTYKDDSGVEHGPVMGIGGDFLVAKNKHGLSPNDEAWAMAYTDALGKALKCIGVASDIYEGTFDGSKWQYQIEQDKIYTVSKTMIDQINEKCPADLKVKLEKKYGSIEAIPSDKFDIVMKSIPCTK
jgi:hypothetical protein